MYNRYSPGPGGQYRRVPQADRQPAASPAPPKPSAAPPPEAPPVPCGSQLRLPLLDRLLPGADNGDLLLLLILLLLLSDGNEDSQSVALTLAIFLCLQ